MVSHISPGLVTEIRFALDLIRKNGTDSDTFGVVCEIVSRRLSEIDADLAELPDSSPASLVALQHALQKVAGELEANRNQPLWNAKHRE